MYCPNCGTEISDDTKVCDHCGYLVESAALLKNTKEQSNSGHLFMKILCFLIPFVGFIYLGTHWEDRSDLAKSYYYLSLAGCVVESIAYLLLGSCSSGGYYYY